MSAQNTKPATASTAPAAPDDDEPARLSALSFSLALAVTLAIFFFLNPFWEALDVVEVDQNVWWSYAPIPLLVLVLLRFERKLSGASWFLETLKLTFVKFAVTYLVGNIWWTLVDTPEARVEPPATVVASAPADAFAPHEAPTPSSLVGVPLRDLAGRVLDAAGRGVPGAFVYVSAGLDDLVFAPDAAPLELVHGAEGWEPELAVLQAHRELRVVSAADALHTVELRDARGKALLNVPAVAGQERALMFSRGRGLLSAQCRVHGHDERPSHLLVLAHPFATRTDAEGRFLLRQVPLAATELATWTPAAGAVTRALDPDETPRLGWELRLP